MIVYVCANELSLGQRAVINKLRYNCRYESYIGQMLYILLRGVFGELL